MKVYVAASSRELTRALRMMDALTRAGFEITHRWPEEILAAGEANPTSASTMKCAEWSADCVVGIETADKIVLLVGDDPSWGAAFEFGYAFARRKSILASGAQKQSIFFSLVDRVDSDEDVVHVLIAETSRGENVS